MNRRHWRLGRPRFFGSTTGLGLSLLIFLLPAGGLSADDTEGAVDTGTEITLGAALEEAAERAFSARLADQRAVAARGDALVAAADFDPFWDLELSYEFARGELLPDQIQAERNRRDLQRNLDTELTRIANDLQTQVEAGGRAVPNCGTVVVVLNGIDICVSDIAKLDFDNLDQLLEILIAENPELAEIRDEQLAVLRQAVLNTIIILRNQARASAEALVKLGEIPRIEERKTLLMDLRLRDRFTSGIFGSAGMILQSVEDNFDDKSLRSSLGGKGLPVAFTSFVGFTLDVPLAGGRGRAVQTAPRRAAELRARAAEAEAAHSRSAAVLEALLAYWRLRIDQQRVATLEQSVARLDRLQELTRTMVDAGELPEIEWVRAQNQVVAAQLALSGARLAVTRGSSTLQLALGREDLQKEDLHAVDTFSGNWAAGVRKLSTDSQGQLQEARGRRQDLKAVTLRSEAARVLEQAAERRLERSLDLSLALGYSGLHESFDDEVYDLEGFGDALTGRNIGPSGSFLLTLRAPVRNWQARGRLLEAGSLVRESEIRRLDLERRIANRLAEIDSRMQQADQALQLRRSAASSLETVLDRMVIALSAGESTLLKTLTTEEQLTRARLATLDAELIVSDLLSRLAFETGYLAEDLVPEAPAAAEADPLG